MQLLSARSSEPSEKPQFSLAALLEFPAVCGVVLALSPCLNPLCVGCLMAMAAALAGRQGLLALLALMGASLAADLPAGPSHRNFAALGQVLVFLLGGLLCAWYQFRGAALPSPDGSQD
jgi:hypothetical protein